MSPEIKNCLGNVYKRVKIKGTKLRFSKTDINMLIYAPTVNSKGWTNFVPHTLLRVGLIAFSIFTQRARVLQNMCHEFFLALKFQK